MAQLFFMELPNTYFQDFPIEFKTINPTDFPSFDVSEKIIIRSDSSGYINTELQRVIDLNRKDTTVINAAVGQGKTYSIIQTVKRYYEASESYLIFIASPFVSLVEQYCKDVHQIGNVPENQIFNYSILGREQVNYTEKKVHVVTANTLLGNPGDDGYKNSNIKREYLNTLIQYSRDNNIKVVFIYDEIHDAIQNFKQEFVFSLWKWRSVIHKNFIISATFNEASKVVIEYLSELTDKKIKIIESERIRFPERQSKLFLHYSDAYHFNSDSNELKALVQQLISRERNIDILCYSRKLAKSIINDTTGTGVILRDTYREINDCTSELISNQRDLNEPPTNRFNSEKCNVGTNFKTGVSIHKRKHALVIILPPRSSRLPFKNKSGIFSGGINSIIQAIARQRTKGEIHIILPKPDPFDFSSLDRAGFNVQQKSFFESHYRNIQHYDVNLSKVNYIPLEYQDFLTLTYYKQQLHYNVYEEIEHVKDLNREGLANLMFYDYKTFKLQRGEDFLSDMYKFYGKDLSSYITYCAFSNQFVNCKLEGVNYKTILFFEEELIEQQFSRYYQQYFDTEYYSLRFDNINFQAAYNEIRNELFSRFSLRYKRSQALNEPIGSYTNKVFEVQLLRFVTRLFFGTATQEIWFDGTRSSYFLHSIKSSLSLSNPGSLSEEVQKKARLYNIISHFRTKLIENIGEYNLGNRRYCYLLRTMPENFFSSRDRELFLELTELVLFDPFIQFNIFQFGRELTLKGFYAKLIEDFFTCEDGRLPIGSRSYIKVINSIKLLPSRSLINLIEPPKEYYSSFFENPEFITTAFESYDEFLKQQREINELLD